MKLAQRVVLSYYYNKLKIIALVSPRAAALQAFKLFCTPYSRRKAQKAPPIFEKATTVVFDFAGFKIKGFQWKTEDLSKHKVLIVHGFDSQSYKFDRYVSLLINEGFEVLAFDAPAHGLSSGKTITVDVYRDLIMEIHHRFGKLSGIMAHSLGALAASLAADKMKGELCNKLILISPSTETTHAINVFFNYLPLPQKVRDGFEKIILEKGGHPSNWYSVARAVQNFTTPTLWIHDSGDTVTPFSDMSFLIDKNLPHLQFLVTEGLGHSPYKDEEVARIIIRSFTELAEPAVKSSISTSNISL
ncbi:MAG: hypothetical protein JWQ96_2598 [Segetibacter sp.]|nr:hypothetical protein [Segetibacter sp.]